MSYLRRRPLGRHSGLYRPLFLTLLALLALAPAASAATDSEVSRSERRQAGLGWDDPGAGGPGNVHAGFLNVVETGRGRAEGHGGFDDFDCPPGAYPDNPGQDQGDSGGCTYLGTRRLDGTDLPFTMRKLRRAGLAGSLTVSEADYDDENPVPTGTITVELSWRGTGSVQRYRSSYRSEVDGVISGGSSRTDERRAIVTGTVGPTSVTSRGGYLLHERSVTYRREQ